MRPLVLLGLFLGFLLSGFVLFDVWSVVSLSSTWTLGDLAMGWAGGSLARRGAAPRLRHSLLCLFCVAVVTMRWVDWNSLKPFLRDLERIQTGMDRAQVETLMSQYIHGTGWPAPPGQGGELELENSVPAACPGSPVYSRTLRRRVRRPSWPLTPAGSSRI